MHVWEGEWVTLRLQIGDLRSYLQAQRQKVVSNALVRRLVVSTMLSAVNDAVGSSAKTGAALLQTSEVWLPLAVGTTVSAVVFSRSMRRGLRPAVRNTAVFFSAWLLWWYPEKLNDFVDVPTSTFFAKIEAPAE